MKLISLNIWQGHLLRQLNQLLSEQQADIMCLQEVYSSEINSPLFEMFSSLERIKQLFPEYHEYFSACYEMNLLGQPFRFGNAILSKYPLSAKETIFINGEFKTYDIFANYVTNTRTLQRVDLELPDGKHLSVLNHHGYWEATPLGTDISIQKMETVAAYIETVARPLVFAGDFNLNSESPALKPLQAQLRDLTQDHSIKSTLSEFGKVSDVACDHIFVSKEINVKSFESSDELVSDHKALIMEFEV